MRNPNDVMHTLIGHFFRRFFDNDTLNTDGDTQTSVVRALCILAGPGLTISFFVAVAVPHFSLWAAIEFHYLFVLYSFVAMGGVAIFEWEMLFPDRIDFLILTPLSVKPRQLLASKTIALLAFLVFFLVGSNIFGIAIAPITTHGAYFRGVLAQSVAVSLAGIFAALFFLAIGGILLCLLDAPRFRIISPVVQTLSVTALALLLVHFVQQGNSLQTMLTGPHLTARWFPPLWFTGVYEQLLLGSHAPSFAPIMTRYALAGTAIAATIVLITYPLAWARMRRMAIEGNTGKRGHRTQWLQPLLHKLVRNPGERAIFHFIGQTLRRNTKYQIYLAMYCGAGLALALAYAVTVQPTASGFRLHLSEVSSNAVIPLLVFWVIAGLRTAFAFPANLQAGWIFRITAVPLREGAAAARKWALACAMSVAGCALLLLAAAGCDARHLLVQLVCGAGVGIWMSDGLFFFQPGVPFNRPRMPGRTSLPMMLTAYLGIFPLMLTQIIRLEAALAHNLRLLFWVVLATVAMRAAFLALRRLLGDFEEEVEGYDGEFVLLGLS